MASCSPGRPRNTERETHFKCAWFKVNNLKQESLHLRCRKMRPNLNSYLVQELPCFATFMKPHPAKCWPVLSSAFHLSSERYLNGQKKKIDAVKTKLERTWLSARHPWKCCLRGCTSNQVMDLLPFITCKAAKAGKRDYDASKPEVTALTAFIYTLLKPSLILYSSSLKYQKTCTILHCKNQ